MSLIQIDELNLNREDLKSASGRIIYQVKAGEINPLRTYLIAKAYKKMVEDVISNVEKEAFVELDKYPKGEKIFGCSPKVTLGGALYDYDQDAEYVRLKTELDNRKKLIDEAIKLFKAGGVVVDNDGAVVEPVPIKNYKKDSIAVTF